MSKRKLNVSGLMLSVGFLSMFIGLLTMISDTHTSYEYFVVTLVPWSMLGAIFFMLDMFEKDDDVVSRLEKLEEKIE